MTATINDDFDSQFSAYAESAKLEESGIDLNALKFFILKVTLPKVRIADALSELREPLADIEHQRWADWQRYQHSKCETSKGEIGALVIPSTLVAQWERKIATDYVSLTDDERESDREQVDRYLPFIAAELSK